MNLSDCTTYSLMRYPGLVDHYKRLMRVRPYSRAARVRAQLSLYLHRPADWQESRRQRSRYDSGLVARIVKHIAELSTYGYRRVWALLRKESEDGGAETVNAKRVYRVMRDNNLLLERKDTPVPARAHNGKVAVLESGFSPINCVSRDLI